MYNTIDLLFHVLNFTIFLLIVFYLFKKYALPKILHAMAAHELMLSMLHKRRDSLRKQEQHIAVAYTNQQLLYEELARKVAQWRQAVLAEQRIDFAQRALIEKQIAARNQERAMHIEQSTIQALVIPQAVKQAQKELEQYFTPERTHIYMHAITQALQKRVS